MRTVLDSIEHLQHGMDQLHDIYSENQEQCQHIHSKCMHLIEEQQSLERQSNELRTMVKYFADYNQIRARIYSPKSIDVLSSEFQQMVVRINQCIAFLSNHVESCPPSFLFIEYTTPHPIVSLTWTVYPVVLCLSISMLHIPQHRKG